MAKPAALPTAAPIDPATISLREMILGADDSRAPREIHVPEWSCTLHVRGMSGKERDAFERYVVANKQQNIRGALAASHICDESGRLIFSMADADRLGEKSAAALDRIVEECKTLSGFTKADIDELEKN